MRNALTDIMSTAIAYALVGIVVAAGAFLIAVTIAAAMDTDEDIW